MQDPRSHTCCFSGYRPEKMPFRTNDPDAVQALEAALDREKDDMKQAIGGLSHLSLRHGSRIRYLGGRGRHPRARAS